MGIFILSPTGFCQVPPAVPRQHPSAHASRTLMPLLFIQLGVPQDAASCYLSSPAHNSQVETHVFCVAIFLVCSSLGQS